MYEVEVDYAPAYEFITSLYFYINKDRLKIYELGTAWKKEIDQKLTPVFKEALKDKRMEVIHRLSLLVPKCPGDRTPETFISWFRGLSPSEMYDCMLPWVREIPKDMFVLHEHFAYLFNEWNEQYFQHIDPLILNLLKQDAKEKRELLINTAPADLVEQSTNGIRIESERVQKLLLVPQYHYAPSSVIDYYEGFITCLYPIENTSSSPFISKRAIHYFSSLSDENRVLILKSLYGSKRTFKELIEITGLAKSNLHYHLAMLRTAGLIRALHSSERVESYSLRLDTASEMQQKFLSYLKGEAT
ncbi:ArsR family transcriptional regulator [Bacillus sp. M6-12]|uniref:ArsR/SmtB family transcription factor n=1 Tax=Bacillus sp. M6-12 TaxID=2054166 RepID=UPI000C757FF3|nr:winged helix-turn-helix domain-containing protein [Bacillus sp. M6-12]PLS15859.1 ArsR family transcriptional regulator [Bacillus sp. M6-12]